VRRDERLTPGRARSHPPGGQSALPVSGVGVGGAGEMVTPFPAGTRRRAVDRLIDAVRAGESRALVLSGEAGGQDALLDYRAEHASGCRVVRTTGVQSEMELAFAGLQQLCKPLLDHLDRLPGPQRGALETAFLAPGPLRTGSWSAWPCRACCPTQPRRSR